MNKNLEIERLRGLAIFMVVIGHISFLHPYIHPALKQTYTGVDLFLVISGYVVTLTMLKRLTVHGETVLLRFKNSLIEIKKFYLRRFFRIIPAALLWSLIPLVLVALFGDPKNRVISNVELLKEFFSVLFFYYNFSYIFHKIPVIIGPYWSLSVEEHFYFIFPLLFVIFYNKKTRILAFSSLALLSILIFRPLIDISKSNPNVDMFEWIRYATQNRLDFLSAGVLLSLTQSPCGHINKWIGKIFSLFLVAIFWISPVLCLKAGIDLNGQLLSFLTLSVLLVFLASKEQDLVLNFPLVKNFFEFLGARSYSLYLIHTSTELFLNGIYPGSGIIHILFWAILTLLFVELTYRFIERPLIGFAKKNF